MTLRLTPLHPLFAAEVHGLDLRQTPGPDLCAAIDRAMDRYAVLVLGVDAPGAGHAALHDMMVTPDYHAALPQSVRDRLVCRVVDKLVPVTQKHDIEGLVMGVE